MITPRLLLKCIEICIDVFFLELNLVIFEMYTIEKETR